MVLGVDERKDFCLRGVLFFFFLRGTWCLVEDIFCLGGSVWIVFKDINNTMRCIFNIFKYVNSACTAHVHESQITTT